MVLMVRKRLISRARRGLRLCWLARAFVAQQNGAMASLTGYRGSAGSSGIGVALGCGNDADDSGELDPPKRS